MKYSKTELLLGGLIVLAITGSVAFAVYDSTNPWTLEQSVDGSEVIESAALESDGERLYLNVSIEDNARQNDRYCTSTYDPALEQTKTTCYDDWHSVQVRHIQVVKIADGFFAENEPVSPLTEVSNSNSASVAIPWESGEYQIRVISEQGWVTTLTVHVSEEDGSYEVSGSNWNNHT